MDKRRCIFAATMTSLVALLLFAAAYLVYTWADSKIPSVQNAAASLMKRYANNCLFNAVLEGNCTQEEAALLREKCNSAMKEEGIFPTVPDGDPAGEGYLQAVSRLMKARVNVFKDNEKVATVLHEDVACVDGLREINLEHFGTSEAGHWEPFSTTAESG